MNQKIKQKPRVHNEYFRPVKLGGRKSCPTCKKKLEPDENIWSWGEYHNARWHTVTHFCKNCYVQIKARLIIHANECGCVFELIVRNADFTPAWLNLDTSKWAEHDGRWGVRYYPDEGGTEAYYFVDGVGWVVDSEDQMPPGVWEKLLTMVGAPLTQT